MADNQVVETMSEKIQRYRRVGWYCHSKCSAYAREYFAQGMITGLEEMIDARLQEFSTAAHAERAMIKKIMEAFNDLQQNDVPIDKRLFESPEWTVFVDALCEFLSAKQLSVGISFVRQMLDQIEDAKM